MTKKYSRITKQLVGLQKKKEKKNSNLQSTLFVKGAIGVNFSTANVIFVKKSLEKMATALLIPVPAASWRQRVSNDWTQKYFSYSDPSFLAADAFQNPRDRWISAKWDHQLLHIQGDQ